MHLLVILRLGNAKACDKILPLLRTPLVEGVTLIRHAPIPVDSPKLTQVIHNVGLHDDGLPASYGASVRNLLACFMRGWSIARNLRPDAVIAFNLFPYGVIAWMVAHLTRLPVVLSLIGSDFDRRLRTPVLGWLLRGMLRTSDRVIIFGHEAREQLLLDGLKPDRLFVLPNTVDTDVFYPDPTILPDFDLIYVGNLHDFKRVDLILRGLSIICQTRPETTLCIVGDGPARTTLETLADGLGIRDAVTFVGWSNDIPGYLRRSRILLLLSEHEGLPAVVIEALCTGLPVIATDVGAVSSIMQDGENGFLLPVSPNPPQVAECALNLLTETELYQRMNKNAVTIRKTHGYEQSAHIWEAIIYNLNSVQK
jgi:glycosyltransferase involved in cell wall biosynthesis